MVRGDEGDACLVEFLDDPGIPERTYARRVIRPAARSRMLTVLRRRLLVAEIVAASGATAAVIAVFLPQRSFGFGRRGRWDIDGFGRIRAVVPDPRQQFVGTGPPLGAVVVIAAMLLVASVWFGRFRRWPTRAVTVALAGVLVGIFACSSVEATTWPHSGWLYGWWISGLAVLCTCVAAAGVYIGRTGRPRVEHRQALEQDPRQPESTAV